MIDQRIFKEKVTLVNVDNSWYAVGTDICELSEYTRANYLFKTYCNKDNYIKALVQDADIKREKILVNSRGILQICNTTHRTISDENRKTLNSVIKELNRLNNADKKDLLKEEIERLKKENKELKEIDKEKTIKATELLDEKMKEIEKNEEIIDLQKTTIENLEKANKKLNNEIQYLKSSLDSCNREEFVLNGKVKTLENELARRDKSLIYSIKARFR